MEITAMWAMYFGGLVAIKAHPKNTDPPDLEACAQLADQMVALTLRRFTEKRSWLDGQQQHKPDSN